MEMTYFGYLNKMNLLHYRRKSWIGKEPGKT